MNKYTMNKYGVTEKGQEAVNLIGACFVIFVIAIVFSRPRAGTTFSGVSVPFDFSSPSSEATSGSDTSPDDGFLPAAKTWPEVDK